MSDRKLLSGWLEWDFCGETGLEDGHRCASRCLRHKSHHFVAERIAGVKMLQSGQNRNHPIPAFVVELQFSDCGTIKSALPLVMLSHGDPSLKICVEDLFLPTNSTGEPLTGFIFRELFLKNAAILRSKAISGQTLASLASQVERDTVVVGTQVAEHCHLHRVAGAVQVLDGLGVAKGHQKTRHSSQTSPTQRRVAKGRVHGPPRTAHRQREKAPPPK
jgi:hypothetical protein